MSIVWIKEDFLENQNKLYLLKHWGLIHQNSYPVFLSWAAKLLVFT